MRLSTTIPTIETFRWFVEKTRHGFHLSKQEFWDVLHLRYDWKLNNTPSHYVCGAVFSPDHAMICKHGGLTFIRHNDI